MIDALTLDQFAVFAAVVDEGSFAGAARRMNRAQSAVTYAIQKLEDQSGVALFDRSTYRPTLTEEGKALLPRARRILSDLEEYRLHARRMTMGLEDELTLAIHPFTPRKRLSEILTDFNRTFPSVRINASLTTRDAALENLRNGSVDLAVAHELISLGEGFERRFYGRMEVVVTAAPDHPLASVKGQINAELLRDHTHLANYGIPSEEEVALLHGLGMDSHTVWRVMDFETMRNLLIAGVGWSSVPRSRIENDVNEGRLVVLRAEGWGAEEGLRIVPLVIARNAGKPAGPAARWLFDRFCSADEDEPAQATVEPERVLD